MFRLFLKNDKIDIAWYITLLIICFVTGYATCLYIHVQPIYGTDLSILERRTCINNGGVRYVVRDTFKPQTYHVFCNDSAIFKTISIVAQEKEQDNERRTLKTIIK